MALRKRTTRPAANKTTRKRTADPTTKYAEQVTAYMTDELGIDDVKTIGKVCALMLKAVEMQLDSEEEVEEEETPIRKSTRKTRTTRKTAKKSEEPDEMQLGRVSLWENSGNGNYEFQGNVQFRFDGGRIKSSKDVDLEVSIILFEPDEDSKYLYSGILTERTIERGRSKKKSPVVGRVYVYDPGSSGRKKGLEAYAYMYLIDPDDEGDNVDPDYLLDYLPEDLVPEEGAFAKLLIYENESDNEDAPLFTGKVILPGELEAGDDDDDDDEEEEEEATPRRRRNARSTKTRTTRSKGEATTRSGRARKSRSTRSTKRKSVLDFSKTDMPDVYEDEDEEYEED